MFTDSCIKGGVLETLGSYRDCGWLGCVRVSGSLLQRPASFRSGSGAFVVALAASEENESQMSKILRRGSGFRILGLGFRVAALGFRVKALG